MSENKTNQNTNKILFVHLITMLSVSAMQQMGKVIPGRAGNPMTGKTEMDLDAAQATIDMLDMLAAKTKGNLDADEERLMKDTLAALKMNFVETKEMQKSEVSGQKSEEDQKKSADKQEDSKARKMANNKAETKDAKFHKSYD